MRRRHRKWRRKRGGEISYAVLQALQQAWYQAERDKRAAEEDSEYELSDRHGFFTSYPDLVEHDAVISLAAFVNDTKLVSQTIMDEDIDIALAAHRAIDYPTSASLHPGFKWLPSGCTAITTRFCASSITA
jgi:hypothetical protein